MISICIPDSIVPPACLCSIPTPIYSRGEYIGTRDVIYAPLTEEFAFDNTYEDHEFFLELSGNEFVKLIERDSLPDWITPEQLFNFSNAHGHIDPVTRKITWIRPRKI
jgi:hypothetical protein